MRKNELHELMFLIKRLDRRFAKEGLNFQDRNAPVLFKRWDVPLSDKRFKAFTEAAVYLGVEIARVDGKVATLCAAPNAEFIKLDKVVHFNWYHLDWLGWAYRNMVVDYVFDMEGYKQRVNFDGLQRSLKLFNGADHRGPLFECAQNEKHERRYRGTLYYDMPPWRQCVPLMYGDSRV